MRMHKDSEMLTRLTCALGEKRDKLAMLLRSISGIGHSENMKPSVFRRFLLTLEHIADMKDDEEKILQQIDAIEAEHRKKRKHKLLRRADMVPEPAAAPTADFNMAPPDDVKRPDNTLLWLVALWYVFTPKKNNDK